MIKQIRNNYIFKKNWALSFYSFQFSFNLSKSGHIFINFSNCHSNRLWKWLSIFKLFFDLINAINPIINQFFINDIWFLYLILSTAKIRFDCSYSIILLIKDEQVPEMCLKLRLLRVYKPLHSLNPTQLSIWEIPLSRQKGSIRHIGSEDGNRSH